MNHVVRTGTNLHREEKDLICEEFLTRTPYCTSTLANLLRLPIRCMQATRSPASLVRGQRATSQFAGAQNEWFMVNLEPKKL